MNTICQKCFQLLSEKLVAYKRIQENGYECVSSCDGVPDGDFQSCLGCDVYATCSNELLYDERPCPANLVWDDHVKKCQYESATCSENGGGDNDGDGHGDHGGRSSSSSSEDNHSYQRKRRN